MSFCNVIGISIHTCLHVFENNSEKAIEYFLHVYIVPSKHLGGGRGGGWGLEEFLKVMQALDYIYILD